MKNLTFDAERIKHEVRIIDYLQSQGVEVKNGRCPATWRGGDNPQAIHINTEKNLWHDFRDGTGGSVIDLCMAVEGLDFAKAVQALGSRFNVQPEGETQKRKRKPKPKVAPNWVIVSWLISQADRRAVIMSEATTLTYADRHWARRVAELLTGKMRGHSLNDAVAVAIRLYHAEAERASGEKGAKR